MTALPLFVSVPHAGTRVPPEIASLNALSAAEIVEDGDEGAAEIYDFAAQVKKLHSTDIARAFVDLNRAADDFRADGVVKTHTCFNRPVYRAAPSAEQVRSLLNAYYHPYHRELARPPAGVVLAVDCHTMLAVGPPIGPGAGVERPHVCLSNADGTCPDDWLDSLLECFRREFGERVSRNDPFKGGHIVRSHAAQMPWVQLELSRAPFAPNVEKRRRVLAALTDWCARHEPAGEAARGR